MCDDVIMLREGLVVDQGSPQELIQGAMARDAWRRCSSTSHAAAAEESDQEVPLPEIAA